MVMSKLSKRIFFILHIFNKHISCARYPFRDIQKFIRHMVSALKEFPVIRKKEAITSVFIALLSH